MKIANILWSFMLFFIFLDSHFFDVSASEVLSVFANANRSLHNCCELFTTVYHLRLILRLTACLSDYRTEFDSAVDKWAQQSRKRCREWRDQCGQCRWRRGRSKGYPLYARCHFHDTSGSTTWEFHREHDEDKREKRHRSDRAAHHVSGNITHCIFRLGCRIVA